MDEDIQELHKYAELENSELGEICRLLCIMAESYQPHLSEDFQQALADEIVAQLVHFKQFSKIVEVTTNRVEIIDILEWL